MTKMFKDRMNRTLFELFCGITVYGVICEAVLFAAFLIVRHAGASFGIAGISTDLWAGILLALIYSYFLWLGIDRSLEYDEASAVKKIRLWFIARYFALMVIFILLCTIGKRNALAVFAGIMGIKVGAYLNKPMKHISDRIYGKEAFAEENIESGGAIQ